MTCPGTTLRFTLCETRISDSRLERICTLAIHLYRWPFELSPGDVTRGGLGSLHMITSARSRSYDTRQRRVRNFRIPSRDTSTSRHQSQFHRITYAITHRYNVAFINDNSTTQLQPCSLTPIDSTLYTASLLWPTLPAKMIPILCASASSSFPPSSTTWSTSQSSPPRQEFAT